ncbi:MAG: HAD family phosphatase [Deltaproteobacteria bacterium]|nr:HAD family phosphatase [Deltaproteobacteria bacterium]
MFDFDGVIVDTEPLHYDAFRKVLEPLGISFTWKTYVDTYLGFDDRDAFREAFRSHGRALEDRRLSQLVEAKSRVFQEILRAGVKVYPGILPMIESLHASGVPMAICSGALRSDIDPILSGLGVARCFLHIVTADDVLKSKPDPECYVLAIRRLSHSRPQVISAPRNCLAVEDTPAGIEAAKGAGLSVLAVTNSHPAEELAGADFVTDSLENVRLTGMP